MNKRLKLYFFSFAGFLILTGLMFCMPAYAAQLQNPLTGVNDFPTLFTKIAGAIGGLIAGLGTVMIIVSGIMFLLSAGNPEKMKNARSTLIYAIIGIAVGTSAKLIADGVLEIMK